MTTPYILLISVLVVITLSILTFWARRVSMLSPVACFVFVISAIGAFVPMAFVFMGVLAHQLPKPNKAKSLRKDFGPIHGETTIEVVSLFLQGDI